MEITHDKLSEDYNEIFYDWYFTWTRINQSNNNYPVLLHKGAASWEGVEPENDGINYYITNAAELAWIAEQVNIEGNTFEGCHIWIIGEKITVRGIDYEHAINFQRKLWNPIGYCGECDCGELCAKTDKNTQEEHSHAFMGDVHFGEDNRQGKDSGFELKLINLSLFVLSYV